MSCLVYKINVIVGGYWRSNALINDIIPDVIVDLISSFVDTGNMLPCKVYNMYSNISNDYDNIIDLIDNSGSIFYISNDNRLYVSGNKKYGRLGVGKMDTDSIIEHEYFKDHRAMAFISSGNASSHTFVYTINNKLYGFGKNTKSQLGLLYPGWYSWEPTLIKYSFDSKLSQIKSGASHSVFLTTKGNVYYCGDSTWVPSKKIKKNSIYQLKCLKNIKLIECTMSNTFCVNNNDILSTFGSKTNGSLNIIPDISVNALSCGKHHIALIANNNGIYTFGNNASSQCGLGNQSKYVSNPTQVRLDFDADIPISIKCGNHHTIIKTLHDNYYSFGLNYHEQCLLNSRRKHIISPTMISINNILSKLNSNKSIINLIPGTDTTYILQTF